MKILRKIKYVCVILYRLSNRRYERNILEEKISHLYRFAEFGKLSSGIFHDLLNPLTAISLNIEKLPTTMSNDSLEIRQLIDKALLASRRMENFIKTVEKQLCCDSECLSFSVNKEIFDAHDLLLYKAHKNNVLLTISFNEEIVTYGNPVRFFQIVTNLVSNAIDSYQQEKECCSNKNRDVMISLILKDSLIKLTIQDFGCGIDKTVMNLIFNPFFTTKPKSKGMGIGLSQTKQIVEKEFYGNIKVESEIDIGSIFTITIPKR